MFEILPHIKVPYTFHNTSSIFFSVFPFLVYLFLELLGAVVVGKHAFVEHAVFKFCKIF